MTSEVSDSMPYVHSRLTCTQSMAATHTRHTLRENNNGSHLHMKRIYNRSRLHALAWWRPTESPVR